ncbi:MULTISPECIES: hypothetical protein [Clostridia]|uniref:hypothetical protein n=1 Tax=Clostridium sp. CCUG 7971 TaxID=2811414 RepID=UPI001ABA6909|nr:hypothetical protein [Clostridium sp. CCUG 7971]MBO3443088.1 hypothetical protein [Clostridium sp. CCUG 7971]
MIGIEKEILILISRVRCMTENQVGKVFGTRRKYGRKPFKKTLRKMCNEYTLRKYPCNINYPGYRDNSYIYYLNGSKMYSGEELLKAVIGSELAIKIDMGGYNLKRFYRNVSVDNRKYDLFIEYINHYGEQKQILVDIDLDGEVDISKYENLEEKIMNSTIPFFETPKVLIVTSSNIETILPKKELFNIECLDLNLNKLFRHI